VTERKKAIIALVIVLGAWSLSSVFVKYLIRAGYDSHTQNFYRYTAGTLLVLPFMARRAVGDGIRPNGRQLLVLLAAIIPNLGHQVSWTVALNWINPGLASFLNKSSVFFSALLAFAFYREERWLYRSKRFLNGVSLTVFGTAGLALLRGDLARMEANLGVGLVIVSAFSWAIYSVTVKRPTAEIGPTMSFGIVGIGTTVVLLLIALRWGDLGKWWQMPWHVNAIMIISGAFCIGVAHTLYYYAMRVLTVSVCATMLLTTPLGTLLISSWLFDEKMTTGQVISGIGLIIGGMLTLLARKKPTSPPLAHVTQTANV
jgi:drug/metabolite transporter (DMT)-like permease